jgi:hypothetical protein
MQKVEGSSPFIRFIRFVLIALLAPARPIIG